MLIFLWKISQGMVQGYHVEYTSVSGRRGRTALPRNVVQSSSSLVKKARESSIGVKGARIFNLLPAHIRNISSDNVDEFKKSLDSFLTNIPDQPTIACRGRAAETNSLLHQIPLFMLNNWVLFLKYLTFYGWQLRWKALTLFICLKFYNKDKDSIHYTTQHSYIEGCCKWDHQNICTE